MSIRLETVHMSDPHDNTELTKNVMMDTVSERNMDNVPQAGDATFGWWLSNPSEK